MKKPSDGDPQWDHLHEKIIGLGEKSIRKSYYPELQRKIRELEQEVAERGRREEELKRNYENRAILNQLLKLSLEDLTLDSLCLTTVEKLYSLSWLTEDAAVTLFLVDGESKSLVRKASIGLESCQEGPCDEVPFGKCLCGIAVATGVVQFASHTDERHSFTSPQMSPHGHYCIPIMFAEKPLGVISLYLPDGHPHDQREEDFFISVANTLAGIIQRHIIVGEKNHYESMLGQAQKIEALGTLSGGIAHDFNNLLAPMLGYAELALRELDTDSRAARRIREVIRAATRAKDLVRQILTLSHKVDFHLDELQPVNLQPVVSEVLSLVRASIPSTIEIVPSLDSSGCNLLVDPSHIHQVVLNLCTNAYHAMREGGGRINISLRKIHLNEEDLRSMPLLLTAGEYMLIIVTDTGHGMDQETVQKIFDPYFTTKKQGEGTGLGLSVVNGIVKSYGGHISVHSELGYGSTFNVYLPCCEDQDQCTIPRSETELPTGTEHILVVDDEPQVGQMTCDSLELLGYRTSLFQNGGEALDRFAQDPQRFDLVLTDMTMPKLTGLDLLKKLRRLRENIPIILCTGFSELINEKKAQDQGFQKFLMKPVLLRELSSAVREVLDGSQ